jgi:hypothetical protein
MAVHRVRLASPGSPLEACRKISMPESASSPAACAGSSRPSGKAMSRAKRSRSTTGLRATRVSMRLHNAAFARVEGEVQERGEVAEEVRRSPNTTSDVAPEGANILWLLWDAQVERPNVNCGSEVRLHRPLTGAGAAVGLEPRV